MESRNKFVEKFDIFQHIVVRLTESTFSAENNKLTYLVYEYLLFERLYSSLTTGFFDWFISAVSSADEVITLLKLIPVEI